MDDIDKELNDLLGDISEMDPKLGEALNGALGGVRGAIDMEKQSYKIAKKAVMRFESLADMAREEAKRNGKDPLRTLHVALRKTVSPDQDPDIIIYGKAFGIAQKIANDITNGAQKKHLKTRIKAKFNKDLQSHIKETNETLTISISYFILQRFKADLMEKWEVGKPPERPQKGKKSSKDTK